MRSVATCTHVNVLLSTHTYSPHTFPCGHTHIHTHTCRHTSRYTCRYTCIHTCRYTCRHTRRHTFTHTCRHTCRHTRVDTMSNLYAGIQTNKYIYIDIHMYKSKHKTVAYMPTYLHIQTQTHAHILTQLNKNKCTHMKTQTQKHAQFRDDCL